MRTLALLTNGGDTCSLNAVIKSIRDNALLSGYTRILAFKDGFQGIINNSVQLLTWAPIDAVQGGTILHSQRYAPRTDAERQEIVEKLLGLEIDTLVVIGGDGTLSATKELYNFVTKHKFPLHLLGFPRTIDNDIKTTTYDGQTEVALCPGYPSAVLKIARLTSALRTTAMSSSKIFVLETMGRDSGWLAAACSLGGAELLLIPEYELQEADWERLCERVARFYQNQGHVIIGVSEGIKVEGKQITDAAMGPRRLGGVGVDVAYQIRNGLNKLLGKDNFEIRYQQAGYFPRMGEPSAYDVQLAEALGWAVGTMLEQKRSGELPVISQVVGGAELKDKVKYIPLSKVEKSFFPVNFFYRQNEFCLTHTGIDFLRKIVDQRKLYDNY